MSIVEIAARAGVSKSTVSLVINNKPSIPSATADRVRRAMKELNYVPAPASMRQGRRSKAAESYRIGVVADMPKAWMRSPLFVDVLHGVEETVRRHDSTMLLVHSSDPADYQRLYGAIDGVILLGLNKSRESLGALASVPCVALFGSTTASLWVDRVVQDDTSIGAIAAQYFIDHGRRRVAVLSREGSAFEGRQATFRQVMEAAGGDVLALDSESSVCVQSDEQYADTDILGPIIDQMLEGHRRPDGLFLPADLFAPAVYFLLIDRGIRPGIDIEIVTCNNERSLLNALKPRPVAIDIHAREIAQAAVDRLIWRINHPEEPRIVIMMQPDLVA